MTTFSQSTTQSTTRRDDKKNTKIQKAQSGDDQNLKEDNTRWKKHFVGNKQETGNYDEIKEDKYDSEERRQN
eukprot:1024959-Amphidinium_carterae.2